MDSADELYKRARQDWTQLVDLGTYGDDDDKPYVATGDLEAALRVDADHVPSLRMLALLLMQMGAMEEAREFADRLLSLRPDDAGARESVRLLRQGDLDAMRDWLVGVWHGGEY